MAVALATSKHWQDETQPDDLLAALDCLRVAITIVDAQGRLVHANRHLNFIFPTLPPSTMKLEKIVNPFLRPDAIRKTLGMADAKDVDVFAEVRRRKDAY